MRTHDLSANRMVDTLKGIKRIAAILMHFDGAYLRFVGDLQISRYRAGELVETFKDEAVARLLEAWRGEVEARAVYTILAERMHDPRRAKVIREIADGDARHRERI